MPVRRLIDCLRIGAPVLIAAWLAAAPASADADPRDVRFPSGWEVAKEIDMPAAQVAGLGTKFDAKLERITNTVWSIAGFAVQVNVVSAADDASAVRAEAALSKARGPGFVGRRGRHVIEIAGENRLAAAFALAHLGALGEAKTTWRVDMKVGCVDDLDAMSANKVFNYFIAIDRGHDAASIEPQLRRLSSGWTMGDRVRLLTAERPWFSAAWTFDPEPKQREAAGDVTVFQFDELPERVGIPYVHVTGRVTVAPRFAPVQTEGDDGSTRPSPHWPSDDPAIVKLAARVTDDATSGRERVRAILLHTWSQIRYAGETGSRYGVPKALEQGFGHCWDKSDVFVTLCRAAGIPARQVAGWVPSMQSGHVWAEVRVPGEGWIPVDPTTPWLGTSADYVPYFRTDDGAMPIVYVASPELVGAE